MTPPGSDAPAGHCCQEDSGSKRSQTSDANEDDLNVPPKKRNKVHEQDRNRQNEDVVADNERKMDEEADTGNSESIGVQGDQVFRVEEAVQAHGQGPLVNWAELPTALFGRVFEWLLFTEERHFFACNGVLWREKRVEYESQMLHTLVLPGKPPLSFLGTLENLESLDFGPYCNNEILEYMQDERVLPKLKHLGMARSLQVTDEGLASLAENPARCRKLETLDITLCRRTTFGATLVLRALLKALILIRRIPKWMEGKTVVGGGICLTYWPDGSFAKVEANGQVVESGYFCDLFELDSENHVICKAQFVEALEFNRGAWRSAPDAEWMRYAYRPAVALLHCSDERTVLRASSLKGSYPFRGFPRPEHSTFIGIERQVYFNHQGERCPAGDPNKCVTVAHRRPVPLDERMPPLDLVEKFHAHMQDMKKVMAGRDQERDERRAHIKTRGRESNAPPPQWFQYYS